ncbi:MAG: response regulator transcription factor [Dehalococcoidales bacterium]|nr:response regulator transcription factor [Dehalococcoidales bacterium]
MDDHALFRRGIAAVLANQEGIEVVGEAVDGLEAIEKAKRFTPDVILMDLNMPRCTGLEAIQALQAEMPHINILVLTVSEMETDLFAAMQFGATGYLLKKTEPEDLIHAILHIARGGVIVSPLMATKLLTEFKDLIAGAGKEAIEKANITLSPQEKEAIEKVDTDLSPREREVLQLVAQGSTNKEIADALFISENTVKTHLKSIMETLHMANRSQAAAYAVKKGLVQYKG